MATKKIQLPDTITFKADGWLENAAIVGWVNIMGDDVIIHDDSIEIPTNTLKDYPEKFFNYFIEEYPEQNKPLNMLEYRELANTTIKGKETLSDVIKKVNDTLHKYLSDKSTINTLKLENVTITKKGNREYLQFDEDYKLFAKETLKNIDPKPVKNKKSNDKKTANAEQYFNDHQATLIKTVKNYINQACNLIQAQLGALSRRYYSYLYINKAWTDSFLRQSESSKISPLDGMTETFLQPAIDFLTNKSTKKEPNEFCANCGRPIYRKNDANGYSWLNFGVDIDRKTSHFWNYQHQSDMCPLCKLIYSAIPAALSFSLDQSIFVNDNRSIQTLIDTNNNIKQSIQSAITSNDHDKNIWSKTFAAFNEQKQKANLRSQNNIEIINAQYDRDKTHYQFINFSSIANEIMQIINSHSFDTNEHGTKTWLSSLTSASIKEFRGNDYYNIYDIVVNHILNAQRLDPLIQDLITLKANNDQNAYFSVNQIQCIIKINRAILIALYQRQAHLFQRRTNMSIPDTTKINANDLKITWAIGQKIAQQYQKENPKKIRSLALQLNNDLRANNLNSFMYKIMTVCANYTISAPNCLARTVDNTDLFKQYADSLLTGLIANINPDKKPNNNSTEKTNN